jgi:dihydrofolate reductase
MRKMTVFNQVSLDGYIADAHGDMSWAHQDDAEWNEFVAENTRGESELVFGRITYELMAGFWPTAAAAASAPVVAQKMNSVSKVVFSRTIQRPEWNNTTLVNGDIAAEVATMKQGPGPDMVIMGSGSIIAQLTDVGLIDEYQIVVNPIVLGGGKSMFDGVSAKVSLALADERAFTNGNVMLSYLPRR